jgi:hypothetical protein
MVQKSLFPIRSIGLAEKKRKYIEVLITVGSLLAVFLAIATQSNTITITNPSVMTVTRNSTIATITSNSTQTIRTGVTINPLDQQIVLWGTLFSILAIALYGFYLFDEQSTRKTGLGTRISFAYLVGILAASLAILAGYGLIFGFTGSAPNNLPYALVIVGVVVGLILIVYLAVVRQLAREEPIPTP